MQEKRIEIIKTIASLTEGRAFYTTNPINVRYLSGFTGEGSLLISREITILITDFRYIEQAAKETNGLYKIVKQTLPGYECLKLLVKEYKIKELAIEEEHITYKDYKELRNTIGEETKITGQEGQTEKLRQVKDESEIFLIKKAAKIGRDAFDYIVQNIKPGMSEVYISNELEYKFKQLGAEGKSFETIVASGKRSAMPHGTASEKIINEGDILTLDFGCIYKGYCSDMTRTFFVGTPRKCDETEKLIKIYNIVAEAQQAAIQAVRPGISGQKLDLVAREYIKSKGYGEYFGHGLGHGVGLMIHEEPNANLRNEKPLVPGNVITIEPGIYIEGLGGVRIEDMVCITNTGCEILTGETCTRL